MHTVQGFNVLISKCNADSKMHFLLKWKNEISSFLVKQLWLGQYFNIVSSNTNVIFQVKKITVLQQQVFNSAVKILLENLTKQNTVISVFFASAFSKSASDAADSECFTRSR